MAKTLKAKDIEALENTATIPLAFDLTGTETMTCPTLSTCNKTYSCPTFDAGCATITSACF